MSLLYASALATCLILLKTLQTMATPVPGNIPREVPNEQAEEYEQFRRATGVAIEEEPEEQSNARFQGCFELTSKGSRDREIKNSISDQVAGGYAIPYVSEADQKSNVTAWENLWSTFEFRNNWEPSTEQWLKVISRKCYQLECVPETPSPAPVYLSAYKRSPWAFLSIRSGE